jgi:hypothetical protein
MKLLLAFLLGLALVVSLPAVAEAHPGTPLQAEQAVYRSHYDGRCGRGFFNRCTYVGIPVADYFEFGHWWHFRDGYYRERRFGRLYECFVRGWVMIRSRRYPHNRHHASFIIEDRWVKCRRA